MTDLITRAEWGARYADGFRDRPIPFSEFWLHHSVTIAPDLLPPFDDDYRAIRRLEEIGQSRFGGGISYNQPVTPAGLVFVGVSPHRQGAHTKGHNTEGFAFVAVGDYSRTGLYPNMIEAIARRMVELRREGKALRHTLNGGHRDASGNSTACPGDAAHAQIPTINARANALWAAGYPAKPTTIPGTNLPLLEVDGRLGPASTLALGTVMRARGFAVVPRTTVGADLVRAIQQDLNRKGLRDRDGRRLVEDGKGFGSNATGRYPREGWTRTITAMERGRGDGKGDMDGFLDARNSRLIRQLQNDINLGGTKDSPVYTG